MPDTKIENGIKYYSASYVNIRINNLYVRDGKTFLRWKILNDRLRALGVISFTEKLTKDDYLNEYDVLRLSAGGKTQAREFFHEVLNDLQNRHNERT